MSTTPISSRLDAELVEQIDSMADHRELNRTQMIERTLRAAITARQRACSQTHRTEKRCGECGLLVQADSTPANI